MTRVSWPRVGALVAKDAAELRAASGVLLGPLSILATAVLLPLAVAVGIPWWTGETLAGEGDLLTLARAVLPARSHGLTDHALVQALLLHQFLPLLAMVPVVGAMALVTTSIVGEKQARTLEPLLATPLEPAELLLAAVGLAFGVAMATLAAGVVLLGGLVTVTAGTGVAAALVSAPAAWLLGGVAPAAALVALTLGAIVSTRARDARSAQQAGVVVVLPIVAGFVAQLTGQQSLAAPALAAVTAGLLLLAALLAVVAVRLFDRERMLTRWT